MCRIWLANQIQAPACTVNELIITYCGSIRPQQAYLVHCGLNIASVSGSHGLQSNGMLAADLDGAHLQLHMKRTSIAFHIACSTAALCTR